MHELFSDISKRNLQEYSSISLKENYYKILIIMMPIIPHFASECIEQLGLSDNFKWPKQNKEKFKTETINYAIQINGKTRKIINEKIDLSQEDLVELIMSDEKLSKYFDEKKKVKKVIFVPNRIINIII